MKQRKGETLEQFNERRRQAYADKKALEGKTVRTQRTGNPMTPVERVQKWRTNPDNKKKETRKHKSARRKEEGFNFWSCDYETTVPKETDTEKVTRVWLWGAVRVKAKGTHTSEDYVHGNTIEDFFEWFFSTPDHTKFSFHNLKFDGNFILWYLIYRLNAEQVDKNTRDVNDLYDGRNLTLYSTLISDSGAWYIINIYKWNSKKLRYDVRQITDSLKLINFSVAQISKAFDCSAPKGECDYTMERPEGYEPTDEEIDYCLTDCKIVAEALFAIKELDIEKMTIASSAKQIAQQKVAEDHIKNKTLTWEEYFPQLTLEEDGFVRRSYKGGFTFTNPYFAEQEINKSGFVLDVNSMYPAVMEYDKLPYGEGIHYDKAYFMHPELKEAGYDYYFQRLLIPRATLKKDGVSVPFVQTKFGRFSNGATYSALLENYEGVFSCVDLELLYENYDVETPEMLEGWAYKSAVGVMTNYLETFAEIKRTSKGAMRTTAKLLLNSLYGKFGSSPTKDIKVANDPTPDEIVHYSVIRNDPDAKNTVYIPYASGVTSRARWRLIRAIRGFGMRYFAYCDTDSVHIVGWDVPDTDSCEELQPYMPEGIELHDSKFGAWKIEERFTRAKYLHAKCYIEDLTSGELSVHVAGLPKNCCKQVNFDNFREGLTVSGKLQPRVIKGGVYLKEVDFSIKPIKAGVLFYPDKEKYRE